jgi:transketolase
MDTSYLKIDPKGYLISTKIRKYVIDMLYEAGSGHPGGSLSWVEIGNDLYFRGGLVYNEHDPNWEGRDRFVLSKGHGVPTLYAIYAILGWLSEEDLRTLRKADMEMPKGKTRYLQGHPSTKNIGIEASTGSLGSGIGVAVGKAYALKIKHGKKSPKVIVVCGDGEHQTEELWAAIREAGNLKLDNLIVYVDHNGLQIDGAVENISSIYPLAEKYKVHKWNVIGREIPFSERSNIFFLEGHDLKWLREANKEARKEEKKPTVIIANTIKGFGVQFMENNPEWHGKAPNKEQRDEAISYLNKLEEECKKLIL